MLQYLRHDKVRYEMCSISYRPVLCLPQRWGITCRVIFNLVPISPWNVTIITVLRPLCRSREERSSLFVCIEDPHWNDTKLDELSDKVPLEHIHINLVILCGVGWLILSSINNLSHITRTLFHQNMKCSNELHTIHWDSWCDIYHHDAWRDLWRNWKDVFPNDFFLSWSDKVMCLSTERNTSCTVRQNTSTVNSYISSTLDMGLKRKK